MPDCPHSENVFPYIQSEYLLLQFMPIASCPPAMPHCEQLILSSSSNHLEGIGRLLLCLLQPSLLHLNKPSSLSISSRGKCSSPQTFLVAFHWTYSSWSMFGKAVLPLVSRVAASLTWLQSNRYICPHESHGPSCFTMFSLTWLCCSVFVGHGLFHALWCCKQENDLRASNPKELYECEQCKELQLARTQVSVGCFT